MKNFTMVITIMAAIVACVGEFSALRAANSPNKVIVVDEPASKPIIPLKPPQVPEPVPQGTFCISNIQLSLNTRLGSWTSTFDQSTCPPSYVSGYYMVWTNSCFLSSGSSCAHLAPGGDVFTFAFNNLIGYSSAVSVGTFTVTCGSGSNVSYPIMVPGGSTSYNFQFGTICLGTSGGCDAFICGSATF